MHVRVHGCVWVCTSVCMYVCMREGAGTAHEVWWVNYSDREWVVMPRVQRSPAES